MYHTYGSLTVDTPCEYFLASDASAVIEHTKRVIFLEDEDVAFIQVFAFLAVGAVTLTQARLNDK